MPEIIHYEIRRELLRLAKTSALQSLERFVHAEHDRFRQLTSRDYMVAAELWAATRRRGLPTADVRALDIVVILAAQIRNSGISQEDVVVATTNCKHLERFVPAEEWNNVR